MRFSKLPLQTQLMHTAASPSVAYLLLVLGLGLLLFEFFTAGIGVAGVVGAGFVVLGGFGVAELPFNSWALALLLASMLAFAIDMQTGIPRLWTIIGMVAYTVGSVFLFTEFRPTWIALLVGVAGMGATVFSGMPAMIRTRFATPTIGREWMVGDMGEADTDIDPEGRVRIRGALWRARTNRATPVRAGESVRVVEIDGLVLEVEPEAELVPEIQSEVAWGKRQKGTHVALYKVPVSTRGWETAGQARYLFEQVWNLRYTEVRSGDIRDGLQDIDVLGTSDINAVARYPYQPVDDPPRTSSTMASYCGLSMRPTQGAVQRLI